MPFKTERFRRIMLNFLVPRASQLAFYPIGKTKYWACFQKVYYIKKLHHIYLSVRRRLESMCTIFMKNCTSITGWKPLISFLEDNCKISLLPLRLFFREI